MSHMHVAFLEVSGLRQLTYKMSGGPRLEAVKGLNIIPSSEQLCPALKRRYLTVCTSRSYPTAVLSYYLVIKMANLEKVTWYFFTSQIFFASLVVPVGSVLGLRQTATTQSRPRDCVIFFCQATCKVYQEFAKIRQDSPRFANICQ